MKESVKVTVIATGIKAEKMGMKPHTMLSPALRTAQQSVKSAMARKEKPPLIAATPDVPATPVPDDDFEVPTYIRKAQRQDTK